MGNLLALEGLSLRRAPRDGAKTWRMEVEAFTLQAGARIGLIGQSGAGKSSFLDALALIAKPAAIESARLLGEDITAQWRAGDDRALAARRAGAIGYVLQEGGLLPYLSLRGNAELAASLCRGRALPSIEDLAAALDILPLLDKRPAHLSGGQRQRAQVLRGLATGAQILLADEPTAALDAANALRTFKTMEQAAQDRAMVVTSHWPELLLDHGFTLCEVKLRDYPSEIIASLEVVAGQR